MEAARSRALREQAVQKPGELPSARGAWSAPATLVRVTQLQTRVLWRDSHAGLFYGLLVYLAN